MYEELVRYVQCNHLWKTQSIQWAIRLHKVMLDLIGMGCGPGKEEWLKWAYQLEGQQANPSEKEMVFMSDAFACQQQKLQL